MDKDDKSKRNSSEPADESKMLTPWQKENLKYLEKLGEESKVQQEPDLNMSVDAKRASGKEVVNNQEELAATEVADEPTEDPVISLRTVKDLPKSKSFADKLPKMKEARQKRVKRRLALLVGVFGLGVIGTSYYVSPLSKLNQVEIVGNQLVSKEAVVASTKLTGEEYIWSAYFNDELIPMIKKDNPRINTVKINVSRLNNLKITISEFAEVAYAKENQIIHSVLENGRILREPTEIKNDSFPVLIGFTEGDNLSYLMAHFSAINTEILNNIKEIQSTPTKTNPYLMTLAMKDGNKIIASTRDFQDKINFYPEVIAQTEEQGIVDMEAGIFFTSFEAIKTQEAAEKTEKERQEWLKLLEEENNEKINE